MAWQIKSVAFGEIQAPDCFHVGLQQASWDFMHDHGNTSGSSNLAILHHELTRSQDMPREYIMCLAGGPGELFAPCILLPHLSA